MHARVQPLCVQSVHAFEFEFEFELLFRIRPPFRCSTPARSRTHVQSTRATHIATFRACAAAAGALPRKWIVAACRYKCTSCRHPQSFFFTYLVDLECDHKRVWERLERSHCTQCTGWSHVTVSCGSSANAGPTLHTIFIFALCSLL